MSKSVLDLIGNTPLVKIKETLAGSDSNIFAKLEMFNPGGSVKDRISLSMIEKAEEEGALTPDSLIIEPTSGNTGIGLSIVAAVKGYKLILTMPESMSVERRQMLSNYGAELVLTPAENGMKGAVAKAEELKKENPNSFIPQQFNNFANPEVHRETTAKEILEELESMKENIDAFVAGVGTGGTITGVGEVLKKHYPGVKIFAVEPESSAVLSGGSPGPHRIQGIGAGFVPEVLNTDVIDDVITIKDEDAYNMSKKLGKNQGILPGISSGAAMAGSLEAKDKLPKGSNIVTVFPDLGERYLSVAPYFDI
ncbi:cysteine synthase A [Natranaerofaba carboxydovora]|uniref:cysteine synthase A n=1 Tax=Natranaerofaba carboxydovora TaxID=2742683 RepID=UPI001F130DCC|nr:Cysteine synthase [Natranaerofaba carboxydovora]